jgi:hypothetical protein
MHKCFSVAHFTKHCIGCLRQKSFWGQTNNCTHNEDRKSRKAINRLHIVLKIEQTIHTRNKI